MTNNIRDILVFIFILIFVYGISIILAERYYKRSNNIKNKIYLDENVSFYGGGWNDDAYLFYDNKAIAVKSIYNIKNMDSAHIEIQKWKNEILNQYKKMNEIK